MTKRNILLSVIFALSIWFCFLFSSTSARADAIIADHLAVSEFENIPDSVVEFIGDHYHIYYVHTSHGSQIVTGIDMVYAESSLYDPPYFYEQSDDLGHNGDTSWVPNTRSYLDSHSDCNMAMFSWCGGCSDNTEEGINIYLNKMTELEADYPDVVFIYMTGHLDGTGPEGNLYARNNQIRGFCWTNQKILFDFADIESYDPDGNYYPDESDYCNWCYTWCSSHPCPDCSGCAHSHCFNCYLKGKAWWWMMAQVSGWNSQKDTIPEIISTSPVQNQLNVPVNANISVVFNIDMDSITINDSTFVVNARSTGLHQGTITYNNQTKTATLDPDFDFAVGEVVTISLTTDIQSSEGIPLEESYIRSFFSEVNNGSGVFRLDSVYQVGIQPYSIFAADLDGDSDLDLATANDSTDDVSILLNDGAGIFGLNAIYSVGHHPRSIIAFDLDRDGDLDLATANDASDDVSLLLNNGYGTFIFDSNYSTGSEPQSVFAADLDGDGDLDLTTANYLSDDVSVLMNDGNGVFGVDSVYPVGDGPVSVFSADLDKDGDLDLISANYGSFLYPDSSVSVLLNNGGGTFAPHSEYYVCNGPYSVIAGDLDGDLHLDLATANSQSDNVSVLLNNGDGTFASPSFYPVGDYPVSLFAADLDGDGDLDLMSANLGFPYNPDSTLSILLNNGDGTFIFDSVYKVGSSPGFVIAADLDGDGDLDLANTNLFSYDVSILLNFLCGDVNRDGEIDLSDPICLADFYFGGGCSIDPQASDVDCDSGINLGDAIIIANYYFGISGFELNCCP